MLLYSKKTQFPDLLERYLLGVVALQYVVRIVRLDEVQADNGARGVGACSSESVNEFSR